MGTLVLTRGEDLGGVLGAGSPDGEAAALELRPDLLLHRLRLAAACSLLAAQPRAIGEQGRRAGDQAALGSGEGKEQPGGKWRDEMAGKFSGQGGAQAPGCWEEEQTTNLNLFRLKFSKRAA